MAFTLQHFLFAFVLLLPTSAVAQTGGNVTIGATIIATENSASWLSPSGDFAFGFQQLKNISDFFLLCMWYNKIPDKTIVWYANGDKPAPRGSKLELFGDSGLVLDNPQGEELWNSDTTTGFVAYGFINDTGNFVLVSTESQTLWESFRHPTDTLLPTQVMDINGLLFSRQKETNFSRGRFQFRFLEDGNAALNPINMLSNNAYDAFYNSSTSDAANSSNSGYQLIFDKNGYFYILRRNNEKFYLTPENMVLGGDYYYRATLNFDGVLTVSRHLKNLTSNQAVQAWTIIKSIPSNICRTVHGEIGSGACGYNNICTLKNDSRPSCSCPPNYSLLDPSDEYGSCKPNFIQGCTQEDGKVSPEDLYTIVELPNTDWPTSDYELLQPFTEEKCRESCLQDCMCAVSVFRDSDKCWKKKLPLSNGRVDNIFNGLKAFLKVRKGNQTILDPGFPSGTSKNDRKIQKKLITVLSSALSVTISVTTVCFCFFFIYHNKRKKIPRTDSFVETNLHCFSYKELEEATDGFKEELGKGAFGVVYKGKITVGSDLHVAVKKLTTVIQDVEKEFRTEVNVIGQTHHKNLVRLLGFCEEGSQRLLVYEFLSNGTLANFLFGECKPKWNQRVEIAFGIARGLLYLHEECSTQIIHCDIKPQNILLDDYYNPRISDFGLAKLLLFDQSHTHTAIRGTKGYVAPEWFRNLPITVKVDVYSFGVLLLEIICCRRSVETEAIESEKAILAYWAYDCFLEGTLNSLVQHDAEALDEIGKVEKFLMIAIWCIQEDPSLRPTMRKVTQMLEGVVQVPVPPCPRPFITPN